MPLARLTRFAIPLAVMTAGSSLPAVAQSYPSDMIRIVLSGGAGTPATSSHALSPTSLGRAKAGGSSSRTSLGH